MPVRSKKPCKKIGCPNLVIYPHRYCDMHIDLEEKENEERNKLYDTHIRHKRDKQYSEFYHSKEWEKLREYVLVSYNYIDLYAYYIDKQIVTATTSHHIEELKENWNKRLDFENQFPVSESSHNRIHALYKKDKKKTQELLKSILEKFKNHESPLPQKV